MRLRRGIGWCALAWLAAAPAARAEIEWATWVQHDVNTATGSFEDGSTMTFEGYIAGIAGGGDLATDPAIPGENTGGGIPPRVNGLTGLPHPGTLQPFAVIMEFDYSQLPTHLAKYFALSDIMCCRSYKLEVLDDAEALVPLGAMTLENYNLILSPTMTADFNVTLNAATGAFGIFNVHEVPDNDYSHTGFAMTSALPAAGRYVRVSSNSIGTQPTEGVHFYFAMDDVPEPGAGSASLAAAVILWMHRRSSRTRRGRGCDRRAH